MLSQRRQAALQAAIESVHLPAPLGGLNTIAAGSLMPPSDCVLLYNMIAAEYGLRSRLGYQEWVTGLTGASDNKVPSLIPFFGSTKNGSANRLFAATSSGLWDCSSSTAAPTLSIAFPVTTGESGQGVSRVVTVPSGHFLFYADEVNGLYRYSETAGTWSKVNSGSVPWAGATAYLIGDLVSNGGNVYLCDTNGTSAASGGPTGVGANIVDNGARWDYVGPENAAPLIYASLADQRAGLTADPANIAFVTVFKNRPWLLEKDTSRAWYLDTSAVAGNATSFDFGSNLQHGGPIAGLFNWSYDGGNGLDTLLVAISAAGDVVIYQGTDPASANTFGLKGVWFVGGVPYGRKVATEDGGELLVCTILGALPLSKLVVSAAATEDSKIYATQKIANLFSLLMGSYRGLFGWSLVIHPEDNALLVTVPVASGVATIQLAMAFSTQSWSQYRDLPIYSAASWNGSLYFGTTDGKVCKNTGYVDNVLLSDPNTFSAVAWSVFGAHQNLGTARQKQVQEVRPIILSQTPQPSVEVTTRYGYSLVEPAPPAGAAGGSGSTWDTAVWNTAVWGGDYSPFAPMMGAAGMGREVAIACRGSAISRTILVGYDILFTQGGYS